MSIKKPIFYHEEAQTHDIDDAAVILPTSFEHKLEISDVDDKGNPVTKRNALQLRADGFFFGVLPDAELEEYPTPCTDVEITHEPITGKVAVLAVTFSSGADPYFKSPLIETIDKEIAENDKTLSEEVSIPLSKKEGLLKRNAFLKAEKEVAKKHFMEGLDVANAVKVYLDGVLADTKVSVVNQENETTVLMAVTYSGQTNTRITESLNNNVKAVEVNLAGQFPYTGSTFNWVKRESVSPDFKKDPDEPSRP